MLKCLTFPEPQAPPVITEVKDLRKTSLNVSWSLIGPRPGQVTYTVFLTANEGAPTKTFSVRGEKMFRR